MHAILEKVSGGDWTLRIYSQAGTSTVLPVTELKLSFAIAQQPGDRPALLCRMCQHVSFDRECADNRYCPACNRFLDPDFPLGTMPII